MKNTVVRAAGTMGIAAALLMSGTAFAQTPGQGWSGRAGTGMHRPANGMMGTRPAVVGTVSAITGDSLTVTSKGFGKNASTTPATAYVVDATNATVFKNNATSSVSAIVVGDTVAVQGSVSGTAVTATTIRDGLSMMRGAMGSTTQMHAGWPGTASTTPNGHKSHVGFMTTVGNFFHSLFHFF